jgi:hypothetical protein
MMGVIQRPAGRAQNEGVKALRVAAVVTSTLVLGAHVLRQGWLVAAVLIAASPLLLLLEGRSPVRVLQGLLGLGALEWVRTTIVLVGLRLAAGAPYLRLVAILGTVAILTAVSAAWLQPWPSRRVAS